MIGFDDPIWESLIGGYRTPYNPVPCLQQLEEGADDLGPIWDELWDELHHQGDVDSASYAAVPHLVRICSERGILDWNAFALVATIEECRQFGENPAVPDWLMSNYVESVREMAAFGADRFGENWPDEMVQAFLAVAAFAKGAPQTGRMLLNISEGEMSSAYDKFFS